MSKKKALKNQGIEFREVIPLGGGNTNTMFWQKWN